MKNLILVTLLSLAPLAASANSLLCTEANAPADAGYQIMLPTDGNTAEVSTESRSGIVKLADLQCQHLMTPQSGQGYVFLRCNEGNGNDAGYSVEVRSSAFVGPISAELSKSTAAGSRPAAALHCLYINNR